MIGALSSDAERANRRSSGSKGCCVSRAVSTSTHLPSESRALTTGSNGLFCAHSAGVTG